MAISQRVLVTGGAGFIGSHVTRRLLELGHSVRVVDNLSTGFRHNLTGIEEHIEFVEGDLRDPSVCARVTARIDTTFHIAALPSVPRSIADPIGSHENNTSATIQLLHACRKAGVQRVVYSSSSSVYGDTPELPKRENVEPLPRSPYAAAKLAGEQYVLAFARAGLVEGVALRYFNVFGPRQDPNGPYAAVIPQLLLAAAAGRTMKIFGDGLQTRDFTFVDNVVSANVLGATLPASRVNGWPVNVGAGVRTSLKDLVQLAEQVTGKRVAVEHAPPREGDVRDSLAGLERARAVLGYEPLVALTDGLDRTWRWMLESRPAVEAVAGAR